MKSLLLPLLAALALPIAVFGLGYEVKTNLMTDEKEIEEKKQQLIISEINLKGFNYYITKASELLGVYGRERDVIDYANRALEIKEDADAYYYLGYAKSDIGRNAEALKNLNQAIDLNSSDPRYFYVRGNTKGSLGDHEEAIKDYKKTIQLQPRHINAYGNLAQAQKDLGLYQEAIRTFDKALSIDPRHSNNFRMRGNIKYELKKYKEAIIDFDKALSIPSKVANDKAWREGVHEDAYYDRAYAYIGLEKYEAACKDFEKAKSLGKNLSEQIVNACNLK